MTEEKRNIFSIKGYTLTAVCYIWDYVEFRFDDDMILRVLVDFTVVREGQRFSSQLAGSKDAVCGLIGKDVSKIKIGEEDVSVCFSDNSCLIISLNEYDPMSGETMHFVFTPDSVHDVW